MKWKASIERALRELRAEEARVAGDLTAVREKIAALGHLAGGKVKSAGKKKRKMSAAGRAAISRAAKRRWAKVRAQKRAAQKA